MVRIVAASWIAMALVASMPSAAGTRAASEELSPTHYDLALTIDYDKEVLEGTADVTVVNRSSKPAGHASFLLYRLLEVRGVTDAGGKALPFTQSVVSFEDFKKLQVNQVKVDFGRPIEPGASTTLRIRYAGYLLGYAETGMRYIQDRIDPDFAILRTDAYAYPIPGLPSYESIRSVPYESFTYSARIDVPKGYTVASGGRLEGTESQGDRTVFRYSSLRPSWRMDFAVAKYSRLSSGPVRLFYLPGDADGAQGVVTAASRSLELFTRWFGPRPDSATLTFIEIPDGWGSQTDGDTVIQAAAAFRDPNRHVEVYHEVSHLWDAPETDHPAPRWNEGLACFLQDLADQALTGIPRIDERTSERIAWLRSKLPKHPEWKEVPLVRYGQANLTGLSYRMGAVFFDLLYRLAGPETFNRIIGTYDQRFKAGGTTQDLAAVIRKETGGKLDRLSDDWLFTTAWVDRIEQTPGVADLESHYRGTSAQARN